MSIISMWNFGALDLKLSPARLSFHVFKRCDQSDQFSRKKKLFRVPCAETLKHYCPSRHAIYCKMIILQWIVFTDLREKALNKAHNNAI